MRDIWVRRLIGRVYRTAVVILLFLLQTHPARAQESYSFGIVPQFEAMRLASIWMPILAELESRTGHRFHMAGSPDIPAFETSFRNGDFDFVYMNPYHAVVAMDRQAYIPLVRDGARQLFGVLVVRKDSALKSPADLEGKTIAFPAPNALGASLLMRADLSRAYGLSYHKIYAATHSSAFLNVILGRAEAAGGVMATLGRQPQDVRDQLRIIYETVRVAPHPVVAHPRVSEEVRADVRQALIDMGRTEAGRALLARIPMQEPVAATTAEYQRLRDLGLEGFVE